MPVPKRYFVSSTFDVRQDDASWNKFKASAFQLIVAMAGGLKSWKLLGGLSAFTDLPNSVLHLWKLDSPAALVEGTHYFEGNQPLYDALVEVCDAPAVQLLEAMPYDPDFKPTGAGTIPPSSDGRFYFLWVELTLRPGAKHRETFVKACENLLVKMKAELPDWALIAAGSTVTGRPSTVMHLWQLKDANSLLEGMNWFGENNPDYVKLAKSCFRQRQDLYTSMIYNPLGQNGKLSPVDKKHASKFKELMLSVTKKGKKNA